MLNCKTFLDRLRQAYHFFVARFVRSSNYDVKSELACSLLVWLQCYGHAEQQVLTMELDRREQEAKDAEQRLQQLGALG